MPESHPYLKFDSCSFVYLFCFYFIYTFLKSVYWKYDHGVFVQELIGHMLQVNVEARYTAEDVLSHPWVTVNVCEKV